VKRTNCFPELIRNCSETAPKLLWNGSETALKRPTEHHTYFNFRIKLILTTYKSVLSLLQSKKLFLKEPIKYLIISSIKLFLHILNSRHIYFRISKSKLYYCRIYARDVLFFFLLKQINTWAKGLHQSNNQTIKQFTSVSKQSVNYSGEKVSGMCYHFGGFFFPSSTKLAR